MTTEKFYRKHYDFHSKLSLWIVPNNLELPDFMSKLLKTDFRLVRGKLLEVLDNNQQCTFCIFFYDHYPAPTKKRKGLIKQHFP